MAAEAAAVAPAEAMGAAVAAAAMAVAMTETTAEIAARFHISHYNNLIYHTLKALEHFPPFHVKGRQQNSV